MKPTKEWLERQAKIIADSSIDDILFYMQEYRDYFSYLEIAEIFSNAYDKMVRQIAKEMKESDEEEEE